MAMIEFEFEGKKYRVDDRFYTSDRCILPDGRTLVATEWSECYPPALRKVSVEKRGYPEAHELEPETAEAIEEAAAK